MEINEIGHDYVAITLSRRNLLALLVKLDGHPPNSACTIAKITDRGVLMVRAVEDDEAYSERSCGKMHPATEVRITTPGLKH